MALRVNQLLQESETERVERVLHIDSPEGCVYLIDIHAKYAWPIKRWVDDILRKLSTKIGPRLRVVPEDPEVRHAHDAKLTEEQRKGIERWYATIKELASEMPQIFDPAYRNKRILALASGEKPLASAPTIRLQLRRYFQRGMDEYALVYDFNRCGTRIDGKPRVITAMLGRPRVNSATPGLNVTPAMLKGMKAAWNFKYHKNLRTRLSEALLYYLLKYEPEATYVDEKGRARIKRGANRLSIDQMRDWYEKEYHPEKSAIARGGNRYNEQEVKPRTSGSHLELFGPGHRYQIDATIANVYLVAEDNRSQIIGRPTVYFIVDDLTGLVVGVYIGLEPPNYWGVAMALLNVIEDKKEYYARYGIPLDPEECFTAPIPTDFLGDRGELKSSKVGVLIGTLVVSIHNAQAMRGDAKGLVESMFRTLPVTFEEYVPGYVDTSTYTPRDGADYKLDATLTLRGFTKIILAEVNARNQTVRRDPKRLLLYPMAASHGVPAAPLPLWKWGEENLPAGGVERDPAHVRKVLLPSTTVTATGTGFKLAEGLPSKSIIFYDYPDEVSGLSAKWANAGRKFEASYDPRRMDSLILHTGADLGRDLVVYLAPPYAHLRDHTLSDLHALYLQIKKNAASHKHFEDEAKLLAEQVVVQTVEEHEIAKRAAMKGNTESNAARVGAIPANRAAARFAQRGAEALTPGLDDNPDASSSSASGPPPPSDVVFPDQSDLLRQVMNRVSAPAPTARPDRGSLPVDEASKT